MIGDQLSSSLRQFNQTFLDSIKQTSQQLDKSIANNDQLVPESFQLQRQYFVSQDTQDLQNLCYKREATINSEENDQNHNKDKEHNLMLDISSIEERNYCQYESRNKQNKKKSDFKQIETILESNNPTPQIDIDYQEQYNKEYAPKTSLRKGIIFSNTQIINESASEQCNMMFSQQKIQNDGFKGQKKDNQNAQIQEDKKLKILKKKKFSRNANIVGLQKPKQLIEVIQKFSNRFKQFFTKRTLKGREKLLSSKIRQQILDLSDFFMTENECCQNPQIFNKKIQIFMYLFKMFRIDKIPVFNPESLLLRLYNLVIAIYNCFFLFIITLNVFFKSDLGYNFTFLVKFTNLIWIFQGVIQLNTAIYQDYKYCQSRVAIIKEYLKKYFFYEVAPLVFLNLQDQAATKKIIFDLMLLLKLKLIMNTFIQLGFNEVQNQINQFICKILFLIIKLMLLAHILACFWSSICYYEIQENDSQNIWSIQQNYFEQDWKNRYVSALYWAFTILTNNQIFMPNTQIEMLSTSFSIIISYIVFAYTISSIINMNDDHIQSNKEFQKDLNALNTYMKRKNIQQELKRRAITYLKEHYQTQQKVDHFKERQSILKLNENLREELLISANSQIINRFSFLSTIFSQECLNQIQNQLIEVFFMPNQIIYDYSLRNDDKYIYFIIEGKVKLIETQMQDYDSSDRYEEASGFEQSYAYLNFDINQPTHFNFRHNQDLSNNHKTEENEKGRIIKEGECFGLFGFFTGFEQIKRAQSIGHTSILKIGRSTVLKIFKKEQKNYEVFKQVGDQILFEKNLSCLGFKCINCNSIDHDSNDCAYTRFDKLNPYIIYKYNHSPEQERDTKFKRTTKNKAKTYTLKLNQIIHSNSNQFRMESNDERIQEQTHKSANSIQDILQSNHNNNNNNNNSINFKRNTISEQLGNALNSKINEDKDNTEDLIDNEYQNFKKQSTYSSQSQNIREELKEQALSYLLKTNYDIISPIEFKGNHSHQVKTQDMPLQQGSSFRGIEYTGEDQSSKRNSIEKKIKKNVSSNISQKLILEKSSIYNQLLPKSQIQLANEFSQMQRTQGSKDYGFNSKTESLLLSLSNILKNVNQINEEQSASPIQNANQQVDQLFSNETDTIRKFNYYFRQYNFQNVINRFNQKQIKKYKKHYKNHLQHQKILQL
ncbi:hypothetical protein ABPG72_018284 [Tetrahymena utriculariae]